MGIVKNLQLERLDLEDRCRQFLEIIDYYGPGVDEGGRADLEDLVEEIKWKLEICKRYYEGF